MIGPYDLGNNIGRPILGELHEELKAAIAKIHKAAVDNGKKTGIYCTSGEQARMYADQGFHMVSFGAFQWPLRLADESHVQISVMADMVALPTFMSQSLAKAQGSYGHAALNMAKGAVYGAANMVSR